MKHLVPDAIFEQHVIVLGKTRSGKSSAMRLMVEHLLDKENPVCIVDPKGDWWGLKASADGKHAGYPVVIFGGEHADVPLNSKSGAAVAELVATGNRSCIIDLGGWMPGARTEFWIDFASTFFRLHRGQHHLVIDEVHNFCPKGKIMDPNAGKMLHWSNRLASEGLGKGIIMLAASQRPQKVHNDFLTSCETLVAMRVIHPSDRKAIAEWIDGCADKSKADEVLTTLASMERGEGWVWSPEADFGPKKIQFPMFSTYDSFKAQKSATPAKLKGWADVDLAEVTKKLESVVKEAEAKDPVKLQAKVKELEKKLASKEHTAAVLDLNKLSKRMPTSTINVQPDPKVIERAVAAVRREWADSLKRARGRIVALGQTPIMKFADVYDTVVATIDMELDAIKAIVSEALKPAKPVTHTAVAQTFTPMFFSSNGDLTGPESKILVALSELLSIGKDKPVKAMAAGWAGYSPKGGAFGNPIGALRSKGYIEYPSPGTVKITDEGLKQVGPRPVPDAEELKQRILRICSGPERKILEALMNHGKEPISKNDLAAASGYAPVGGAFGNPIGALRTKGFLDYPQPGMVQAADWLFEVS